MYFPGKTALPLPVGMVLLMLLQCHSRSADGQMRPWRPEERFGAVARNSFFGHSRIVKNLPVGPRIVNKPNGVPRMVTQSAQKEFTAVHYKSLDLF